MSLVKDPEAVTSASAAGDVLCEAISMGDALRRMARRRPDHEVLVMPEGRWTYGEMLTEAERIARSLIGLGLPQGAHVGVLMPNSFECLSTIFGIALAGCTIVPINARYKPKEIAYIVGNGDLQAIVTSDLVDDYLDYADAIARACPGLSEAADPLHVGLPDFPHLRAAVLLGTKEPAGFLSRERFLGLGDAVDAAQVDRRSQALSLRDPAMVLYTSGTTAQPRGCLVSHEAIARVWGSVAASHQLTAEDRMWNPCPMFHIAAIGVSLACVLRGTTILSTRFIDYTTSLELLAAERPTALYPAYADIMYGIINHPRYGELDLSGVKSVLAVGPPTVLRALQETIAPAVLVSTFGMTESCGCAVNHRLDDPIEVRTQTSGLPLPGLEVRITEPATGEVLPPGTPGEIRIKGPMLFDGYYKDPEKTADALEDGWLHTGDQGVLDATGRLTFRGRIKDMLKVGGENVAPAQVEAHLIAHPAVHMAALIGIPDPKLGQVGAAYVELIEGRSATEEELIAHCREDLARFKVPRHIRIITAEEWPMSATKIQKFRLQQRLIDELGLDAPA